MRGSALIHLAFSMILVVGYQDVNNGKNTGKVLLGATFQTVNGAKVTLAEIKPNENFNQEGGESIIFLDNQGGALARYVYLGADMVETVQGIDESYASLTIGWYTEDAWTAVQDWAGGGEGPAPALVNQNSVQLENGESVMLSPDANGGFISSGEVASEDIEITGDGSGKVFRCNCSPVPITLGQLLPNDKFNQEGGESMIFIDNEGGALARYVYLGADMVETVQGIDESYATLTIGWYTEDAWTAVQDWAGGGEGPAPALENQNSVELAPGHGFMFSPDKDGGFFIPSAID